MTVADCMNQMGCFAAGENLLDWGCLILCHSLVRANKPQENITCQASAGLLERESDLDI